MSLDVELRSLRVGGTELLRQLSVHVPAGAVHTLMGPSGCGKSSLLAALCGLAAPAVVFDGSVRLDGHALDGLDTRQRRIGLLFQDDLLFAHMTVRENLLFAVPAGPRAEREAAVAEALRELQMPGFADADPATLSGGQRSRVALMRALLARPRALLLDEPFSRLDATLRAHLREFVFGTLRTHRIPALLVTHDEADVADPAALTRLEAPAPADRRHPPPASRTGH